MHTRDQIAILKDELSELQRGAVSVNICMLQRDEGNDEGVLPALAEKNEGVLPALDWYCCDCGVKKISQNPKSQNPNVMKQACDSCGAKESWGRLKSGQKRARTMACTSAELGEEPNQLIPWLELPPIRPLPAIVPALAAEDEEATGKSPALAEEDEVTDWYCCICGVQQSQKPFDLSCSACVATQPFFVVHGYKRARTSGIVAEEPTLESLNETLDAEFGMLQAGLDRVSQKFAAKFASPAPSTTSAVAGTSPEPSDPDTQNSPDKAASTSRMDAEEATVQHTSPVDTMPSPVVLDLTDEMTGSHDDTQHYDESQPGLPDYEDAQSPEYEDSQLPDYEDSQRPT